ncbi:hypothetical protein J6590_058960 [Homalodisca vitripennis]|nr:hypothetical protein J6590_058958 [Homalodisca vitripennis]KAG8296360.1 hypothetical protein J6590_058960 [Homalodisca vitripennis]
MIRFPDQRHNEATTCSSYSFHPTSFRGRAGLSKDPDNRMSDNRRPDYRGFTVCVESTSTGSDN